MQSYVAVFQYRNSLFALWYDHVYQAKNKPPNRKWQKVLLVMRHFREFCMGEFITLAQLVSTHIPVSQDKSNLVRNSKYTMYVYNAYLHCYKVVSLCKIWLIFKVLFMCMQSTSRKQQRVSRSKSAKCK